MTGRVAFAVRRTAAAGVASACALSALFPVFQNSSWFWKAFWIIALVALVGVLCRIARVPRVLQPLLTTLAAAAYLVVVFAPSTLSSGLPTGRTLDALNALSVAGQNDISKYGAPIAPTEGLILLTCAGVALVAIAVDLIAVVLDRVAIAGLPLLVLFAVPSAVLPGGLGTTAFAITATGWLVLLLAEGSERVGRWGPPMRTSLPGARPGGDDSSLGRVGRRVGAAALGVAVLVPALIPGLDHRLVGGHGSGPGAGSGPSSAVTFNPITRLRGDLARSSPEQLLVYTTNDPQPDYLRVTTLDVYDGNGWSSSKLTADRQRANVQHGISTPPGEADTIGHITYQTKLAVDETHLDLRWLPVPYGPRKVRVQGTWLWDPRSQTIFSASNSTKSLPPYTVNGSRVAPTRSDLIGVDGQVVDPDVQSYYGESLSVPDDVNALARRLTRGQPTEYDKALAIQEYFRSPRNGFVYDLNASAGFPGQDPLDAFLSGKHGFCEQYASAMAVLLRQAGIPSRVAVGFTSGQAVVGKPNTYRITTADAHAWPEAWFAGIGWVRFEPTPGTTNGETLPDYTAPPPTKTKGGASDSQPTASPTPASKNALKFHDPEILLDRPSNATPGIAPTKSTGWGVFVLAALVALALPWLGTFAIRRSRSRRSDPLVAWAQLADDVADVGGPWHAADSPRAAAARLEPLVGSSAQAALARLATAAELRRYAPPGRGGGGDLVSDGTAVRRALQASAPRLVRWRAVLWPPSTLRFAAHQVSERIADALDLIDRGIALVFRPFRKVVRPG